MVYTEWTGLAVDDSNLREALVDCHRLMGRLRHGWDNIVASAELRAWVRRDVATMNDSAPAPARDAAA
jgi:hypothetical protein